MPNRSYTGTSSGTSWASMPYTSEAIQQMWDEFQQECVQADRVMEQKMREGEERIEEMGKYPLFFWRETCKEKNGDT